jgi:hypothetical protein
MNKSARNDTAMRQAVQEDRFSSTGRWIAIVLVRSD